MTVKDNEARGQGIQQSNVDGTLAFLGLELIGSLPDINFSLFDFHKRKRLFYAYFLKIRQFAFNLHF